MRRRRIGLALAIALCSLGTVLLVGAVAVRVALGVPSPVLMVPLGGGFVMLLASVVPFVFGSLPRITRAVTSVDGRHIVVSKPHPRFVAAVSEIR